MIAWLAQPVLSLLYRYILCSVHCYHYYCYCCCLLCCCCTAVLNLSLSQSRGFVFHSLCGGGAAAAWSQTLAGAKPSQISSRGVTIQPKTNLQDEADKGTGYCNPGTSLRPGKLEPSSQGGMRCPLRDQNIGEESNSTYKHRPR